MEGFSYVNIFDTKGIEYLAIIAFLLLLIPFWLMLNRKVKIRERAMQVLRSVTAGILRIPQGVYFSENHTWAFLERSGMARVGLDDLVLHLTGAITIKSMRSPGDQVRKGDLLTEISQNGKHLKICSPISGIITGINHEIEEQPALLNEDPYKMGWIAQIRPVAWKKETSTCYLAEEATGWSHRELDRFKDFVAETMKKYSPEMSAAILQDGGELCDHSLSELPDELWQDFQTAFLTFKA